MKIVEYKNDFLIPLQKIYLESRKTTFTWLDVDAFTLQDFERDSNGERIWVALDNNKPVGFISLWEADDFIHHLYISPEHQNKGIGNELLKVIKPIYKNLTLKCLSKNLRAIGFYEKQGFVKCSKETDQRSALREAIEVVDKFKRVSNIKSVK